MSEALNVESKRGEKFWSSKEHSAVHLVDREDAFDKIAYTISNPVSSWLLP